MQAPKESPKKLNRAGKPSPEPSPEPTKRPEYQFLRISGSPGHDTGTAAAAAATTTTLPTYGDATGSPESRQDPGDSRPIFCDHRPIPENTFDRILVGRPESFGRETPPKERKRKRLLRAVGKVAGIAAVRVKEMAKSQEMKGERGGKWGRYSELPKGEDIESL